MPWANEYPPISLERRAEIRAQLEAALEEELVAWEAERDAQIRWVTSGITWVTKIKDKRWIDGQWKSDNPSKKTIHPCCEP